jgi:hypothetical protein
MATMFPVGLRISRPLISGNGSASWIDSNVRPHLEELNTHLGKRMFERRGAKVGFRPLIS